MRRFFVVILAWSVATALTGEQDPQSIIKTFKTNNGFGVASLAGITSRNGRVSSISGINFLPSDSNPYYFPMGRSGDKIPEPISFSKQENGKFTTGQIKYGPGSVSVTSVARSGLPEDSSIVKSANIKTPAVQTMFMNGITSRNGRVSSISAINFFPSDSNPYYFPMGRSGDKIPEPISFSKQENGKFTAGQIKYGPGSVSVTSVARSGLPEDSSIVKSANIKTPAVQTMFKSSSQFKPSDMIFQDPFSTFNSRSLNPWFPNTFMFRQPTFQNMNSVRSGWPYSNFSPLFNFWRR